MVILDEADEMTTDAQNALRRGNMRRLESRSLFSVNPMFIFLISYGEIHREHKILSHLQLSQQDHSSSTVSLYEI